MPELPLNIPSLMSMIARMKQQSGPIVSAVLLSADGRSKQVTLDMTPKEDAVGQLLGGKATFVGSYPAPLDGVVMALREDVAKELRAPVNKHVLPPPYDRDAGKLRGPFVLLRMDADSNPADVTLQEYQEFKADPAAAIAKAKAERGAQQGSDEDEEDEQDEEEEQDEDEEDEEAALAAAAAAAASSGRGKKRGMSTEQAAALARSKRKSMGIPEPEEEEQEQPKAKRAKKAAAAPAAAGKKRK